jgi:peptide/nickel transport system substrate-binding protein
MPSGAGSGRLYTFNCTHKDPVLAEIFSNPKFNEAMSLALNREEINQTLNFGLSKPTQALPVHPAVSFAKPEWFTYKTEYDPEQANAILDDIGLTKGADGFRMRPDGKPLVVQIIYPVQAGDVALHELAKEYWDAVGVRIELKEVSTEAYRTMASNNDHDIAVYDSGTTIEPALYANPFRMTPPFGDAALEPQCGAPWAEWHDTNGASGQEPPADVQKLWGLVDKWKSAPQGSPEYAALGTEIVEIFRAHFWHIGTVTSTPSLTIVSRSLGNVPEYKINAFEFYRMYPVRPDQWYFKTAAANN